MAGISGLALLIALPATAVAQANARVAAGADGGWQALVGCWAPITPRLAESIESDMSELDMSELDMSELNMSDLDMSDLDALDPVGSGEARAPLMCVGERANGAVAITTLVDGRIESEELVVADGAPHAAREGGCETTETATWSDDAVRLYLRSTRRCAGNGAGTDIARVLAVSGTGALVDVRAVGADDQYSVRVVHYRSLASGEYPASMRDLADAADETARVFASAPLSLDDVVEAGALLPASAVQAMLVSLPTHRIHVDAHALLVLDEAGVDDEVIDLVVALAYPEQFAVAATGDAAYETYPAGGAVYVPAPYGRYRYDPYGYRGYRRGGAFGYGGYYSPFGYRHYPWGYDRGGTIIIIDRDEGGSGSVRGRLIKGRGYTRAGGGSSGAIDDEQRANPRTYFDSSRRGGGNDGGGASASSRGRSGGSADNGGGDGGSPPRRARPKTP